MSHCYNDSSPKTISSLVALDLIVGPPCIGSRILLPWSVARLHPNKRGDRYSVIYRGKLLVANSRDPECDAARALGGLGVTGKLTMLDGKTGKPRTILDIAAAAKLTVEEGPYGPRFVRRRTVVDRPLTAESGDPGGEIAATCERALALLRRRAS